MFLLTFMPWKVGPHLIVKAILLQHSIISKVLYYTEFIWDMFVDIQLYHYVQLYFYSILLFNIILLHYWNLLSAKNTWSGA